MVAMGASGRSRGPTSEVSRRAFLSAGFRGVSTFVGLASLGGCSYRRATLFVGENTEAQGPTMSNVARVGPLQPADENGVMLPRGFTSRIVARSGQRPLPGPHAWHGAPDGGACFSAPGGGWAYVSNAERERGLG